MLKASAVVELVWQDASGSTSATTLWASSGLTVTEIDANATALASILASLTGAVLVRQRIKYLSVPDDVPVASGGASIKRTGAFFFGTGDDTPLAIILVHAIKDALIVSSGSGAGVAIDTSDSDVIAFKDAVIGGIFVNPFNDDITELDAAYLQSRV